MDGWVVIGTELDTEQLEKDIKNAEKKLASFKKEEERLLREKGKVDSKLSNYEAEKKAIQDNTNELLKMAQTDEQTANLLNLENIELEKLTTKYSKQLESIQEINSQLTENRTNQELMNNSISEMNNKLNKTKGYDNIKNGLEKINNSMSGVIKKVIRWSLAVFSVRSAYNLIRQASSTLAQYNEQYASNLEYLRFVLAQSIAPVLQFLVNLAYRLLTYINYIANAWFGINLFSNASAKNFQKMAGSAKSINKSLQTAGFDEMNVLTDTASAGGAGGVSAPSVDLSSMQGEIPSWIQWIVDNGPLLLAIVAGLTAGIIALKAGLAGITSLGIGVLVAGIVMVIQDVIDLIENPSWQNFVALLGSIAVVIGGVMLAMGNWWGLLVAIVGLAVKLVAENWDEIKQILIKIGDWVWNNVIMPVWRFIQNLFDTIVSIIKLAISIISGIFTTLISIVKAPFIALQATVESVISGAKKIIQGFSQVFKGIFTGDMKLALEGFKNIFSGVFEALWGIAKYPLNLIIGGINALIDGANKIKFDVPDWVPGLGGKTWGFNISKIPMLRTGAVINNPGYGVPVAGGRARGGEAGMEGILPLTDSRAMELLGETIGRYITITNVIENKMNGKMLSRQIQQSKAQQDFAYNN